MNASIAQSLPKPVSLTQKMPKLIEQLKTDYPTRPAKAPLPTAHIYLRPRRNIGRHKALGVSQWLDGQMCVFLGYSEDNMFEMFVPTRAIMALKRQARVAEARPGYQLLKFLIGLYSKI